MGARLPDLPERPSDTVSYHRRRTVSHSSAVGLRSAWESFGVDRLLTGSDFPALEPFDGYKASINYLRHAGLPEADVEQILHQNAPRLFDLASGWSSTDCSTTENGPWKSARHSDRWG
jgi:aminocarboxymuconate-semialdehyde decarboxylase